MKSSFYEHLRDGFLICVYLLGKALVHGLLYLIGLYFLALFLLRLTDLTP